MLLCFLHATKKNTFFFVFCRKSSHNENTVLWVVYFYCFFKYVAWVLCKPVMRTWLLKREKIAGGGEGVGHLSHCEKVTPKASEGPSAGWSSSDNGFIWFFAETKEFVWMTFRCILAGRRRDEPESQTRTRTQRLFSFTCHISPAREPLRCPSEGCSSLLHFTVSYIIAAGCSPDTVWLLANRLSVFLSLIFKCHYSQCDYY